MLNQLRNATRSWVAGIFIAVLAMSFAVWGVSDMFAGGARNAVAVVGETRITTQEFADVFRRRMQQIAEDSGRALTPEEAIELGVDRQLLSLMVRDASYQEAARELGLWVSDDLVADEIAQIDAFRNPITGAFDQRQYVGVLNQNGETPQGFERAIRNNILQFQLMSAVTAGVSAPDALIEQRARFDGERRAVTLVRVPADAAPEPAAPSEEELSAYYEANLSRYQAPELREITIFMYGVDQLMSGIEIDDETVAALYEERRSQFETPERRTVVEMTAPDEATAADIAARLEAGEEPAAIAEALSLTAPIVHEEATPADFADRVAGERAFELEAGAISAPFRGTITWKVVRVDDVAPAAVTPLEGAALELRAQIAQEQATAVWIEAITDFNRLRDRTGATLEEAANEIGAAAIAAGPFDRQGRDLSGYRFELLTEDAEILELAFERPVNAATELTPLGDSGYFALRVDRIIAPAPRSFEEVRDQVAEHWALEQRAEALGDIAQNIQEALEAGGPGDIVATAAHPDAEAASAVVARGLGIIEGIDPRLEALIFRASVGDTAVGGGADSAAIIARVDEIIIDEAASEASRERAREALHEQIAADIAELHRRALSQRYETQINPSELARAAGVTDGS